MLGKVVASFLFCLCAQNSEKKWVQEGQMEKMKGKD